MSDYLATADAMTVLDIIAAEFSSDPSSVRCFDLRVVKRAEELTKAWRAAGAPTPATVLASIDEWLGNSEGLMIEDVIEWRKQLAAAIGAPPRE